MSLTEISIRVAIVAVLAVGALVAIGWRRPASHYPRRIPSSGATARSSERDGASTADAHEVDTLAQSSSRKILDLLGLGSIAVFVGILVTISIATAIAWMVTALLDRL